MNFVFAMCHLYSETQKPPRFASPDTLEHEIGSRWKMLLHAYEAQKAELEEKYKQDIRTLEHDTARAAEEFEMKKIQRSKFIRASNLTLNIRCW